MTRQIAIATVFATLLALTGCANQVGSTEAEVVDDTITVDGGTLNITGSATILDAAQPREWLIHLEWNDGIRPLSTEIDGPLVDRLGNLTPAGEKLQAFLSRVDPEVLQLMNEMDGLPVAPGPIQPLSGSMLQVDLAAVLAAPRVGISLDTDLALPTCGSDDSFYDCLAQR